MFTQVFEQGTMLQLLADLLKWGDLPSIMTTNKQMHTDLGNYMTRGWGCTWSELFALSRILCPPARILASAGSASPVFCTQKGTSPFPPAKILRR